MNMVIFFIFVLFWSVTDCLCPKVFAYGGAMIFPEIVCSHRLIPYHGGYYYSLLPKDGRNATPNGLLERNGAIVLFLPAFDGRFTKS
jgi:hypothetical protein